MNKSVHRNEIILYHSEITELNPYELAILSAIKLIAINQFDCRNEYCSINPKNIITILNNSDIPCADKTKRAIYKSFKTLIGKNIFECNKKTGSTYYIKRSQLLFKKEMFVSLKHSDFINVFSNQLTSENIKLYNCYIKLLSTININTKISYPSLEYLAEKFNTSIKTAQKYTKLLEGRKLILIYRQKTYDSKTGKFRSYNNIYYKPCDAEFVSKKYNIDLLQTIK